MTNLDDGQQLNDEVIKLAAKELLSRLSGNKDDETGKKIVQFILTLFTITKMSVEVFSNLEDFLLLIKSGKLTDENGLEELIRDISSANTSSSFFLPLVKEVLTIGQNTVFEKQTEPKKGFRQPKKKQQIKTATQVSREMQAVLDDYIKKRDLVEEEYKKKMEGIYKEKEKSYEVYIEELNESHKKHIKGLEDIYKERIIYLEKIYDEREKEFNNNVSELLNVYTKHNEKRNKLDEEHINAIKGIFKNRDNRLRQKVLAARNSEGYIKDFCEELLKEWDPLEVENQAYPTKVIQPLTIEALTAFLDACFSDRAKNEDDIKNLLKELNENNITLEDLANSFVKTKDVLFDYEKESFSYYSSPEYQSIARLDKHPHPTKWSHIGIVAFMLELVNDKYFEYRKSIISSEVAKETESFRKKLRDFYNSNT